jgi:phytoene/squalene synthetase
MAELDADRALALTYAPASVREALRTLWRLDAALGAVLAGGREPLISQIKLAWWRDSLVALDFKKPPAEPALEAAAERLKNGSERWPTVLRPLGMLVRLAKRDAMRPLEEMEPHGTPARMWQMLRHRFSGR